MKYFSLIYSFFLKVGAQHRTPFTILRSPPDLRSRTQRIVSPRCPSLIHFRAPPFFLTAWVEFLVCFIFFFLLRKAFDTINLFFITIPALFHRFLIYILMKVFSKNSVIFISFYLSYFEEVFFFNFQVLFCFVLLSFNVYWVPNGYHFTYRIGELGISTYNSGSEEPKTRPPVPRDLCL